MNDVSKFDILIIILFFSAFIIIIIIRILFAKSQINKEFFIKPVTVPLPDTVISDMSLSTPQQLEQQKQKQEQEKIQYDKQLQQLIQKQKEHQIKQWRELQQQNNMPLNINNYKCGIPQNLPHPVTTHTYNPSCCPNPINLTMIPMYQEDYIKASNYGKMQNFVEPQYVGVKLLPKDNKVLYPVFAEVPEFPEPRNYIFNY